MRRINAVSVLPTLFTLGNLVCGFFALVVAARVEKPLIDPVNDPAQLATSKIGTVNPVRAFRALDAENPTHNMMLAGWLIFMAMIFDALDGHVARLSNSASDFGAQLDSLCDVVSFGVAPGFMVVKMSPHMEYLHSYAAWMIAALFAVCAALRLARFNVETGEDDDHAHFSGLPSPAAAASIAGFAILFYTLRLDDNPFEYREQVDLWLQTSLPFFAIVVALLMVSRLPYPHIVNQIFRGQRSFAHVVFLVFAVLAVMLVHGYAVPIVCCMFVFVGPIHYVWETVVQRRKRDEPLF